MKIPAYFVVFLALFLTPAVRAEIPVSTLTSIYPPGGQPNTEFNVTIAGSAIDHADNLYCPHPDIDFEKVSDTEFKCSIGPDVKAGRYTVQLHGKRGISSSRLFVVNSLPTLNEQDNSESDDTITELQLPIAAHGAIGGNGDIDRYSFNAQAGEVVLIECWAERIDSTLRTNLEVFDSDNRKLQAEQSRFGTDMMLALRIPATGKYTAKLSDLVFSGSANSIYRLEIHSQPRVLFTIPAAVTEGSTAEVQAYGYNLNGTPTDAVIESTPVTVAAADVQADHRIPAFADSTSATVSETPIGILDAVHPVGLAVTSNPVIATTNANVDINTALPVQIPIDITGQLPQAQDRHWYSVDLRAGQTININGIGARIGSPVDLAIHIFSPDGSKQIVVLNDGTFNIGGTRFPTGHFDPTGEFTAPKDGTYFLVIRNRIGSNSADSRRIYRLQIAWQKPDISVIAIGNKATTPSGFTVRPGGYETIHLLAPEHKTSTHSIRISASGLPAGVTCEDVWIGPGISQVPLTIRAVETASSWVGTFNLQASIEIGGETITKPVLAGVMSRTGTPTGVGRLDSQLSLAVTDRAPITATATIDRKRYQQGSIIDLNITVDRVDGQPKAEAKLNGDSLPPHLRDRVTTIPAGETQGVASFYIPEHLAPGMYTIAARVRTSHSYPLDPALGTAKEAATTVLTNAVSFEVYPAPYILRIDLDAPKKIKRGQVIQMPYSCIRNNQFIGKIHTEIRAPGGVVGIRGRGVTFVGQTETGVIQIIANEDAPLGKQPGLRLEGLGTVEDEGIHLGSAFLDLEIVE